MKEIVGLTIENHRVRKALGECEKTLRRLRDLTQSSAKPEIREWAARALDAVNNDAVHELWSNLAPGTNSWHGIQQLVDEGVASETGDLPDLVNSLRFVISTSILLL